MTILCASQTTVGSAILGYDERKFMSEAERREIAETLFERAQNREQIKHAMRLEEKRRATLVKNLYRLQGLRLSRNQGSNLKPADKSA
jgi:hypothetical protein